MKNRLNSFKIVLAFCLTFFILTIEATFFLQKVNATFDQNNDQGFATVDFSTGDASGVAASSSLSFQPTYVELQNSITTGSLTTVNIRPNSFLGWKNIEVSGNFGLNQAKLQLYTCNTTPQLLTDSSFAGNSTGNHLNSSYQLDISSLDKLAFPCVKVKILLDQDGGANPQIQQVKTSWVPQSVFLLELTTPTTKQAGEIITHEIDYSVSYVADSNVILYLPLPTPKAGTYTAAYGQNLNLTATNYVSSSNGGIYTASGLTIAGIAVPANSIYWNLGAVPSGSAGSVTAILRSINGTENGVIYEPEVTIASADAGSVSSKKSITITSVSRPTLSKTAGNTIILGGINRVVMTAPYNGNVNYRIGIANSSSTGTSTLFNPTVTDNLTAICNYLTSQCGVASCASRISNISDSGTLSGTTITWPVQTNIAPGGSKNLSFNVNYLGCPDNTAVVNTANSVGSNYTNRTALVSVSMGLDTAPRATFAKGDRTRLAGINNSVTANSDNNSPYAVNDLADMRGKTAYNDTTVYLLKASNTGPVRLDNIALIDKIPSGLSLVSIKVPGVANARYYYSVTNAYNDPTLSPPFDANNPSSPGADWTETLPSDLSSVTWVAAYVPCLRSSFFAAAGTCLNAPSSAQAEVTVRVKPLTSSADQCQTENTTNLAQAKILKGATDPTAQADTDVTNLVSPFNFSDGQEKTWFTPAVPSFLAGNTKITGPSSLEAGAVGSYNLTVKNDGLGLATNLQIEIPIPKVNVGGTDQYLDFVSFTGSAYSLEYDGSKVSKVIANANNLGVGATKNFTIQLVSPLGVSSGTIYTLIGKVTAQDQNNCAMPNLIVNTSTTLTGTPRLNIFESKDEGSISSCGNIHYQLNFDSRGNVSTTNTYLVSRIPEKTNFVEAYTNGTALDDNLNNFTCQNCKVYFSKNIPPLPNNPSVSSPLSISLIQSNFTLGVETSPGVWKPPANLPDNQVLYVAYLVDDNSLPNHQLTAGQVGKVGLKVVNADSAQVSGCSELGTLIYSYPAVLAGELIQAIGNTTVVTVLNDPGLELKKSASVESVRVGEEFYYYLDYKNNSGIADNFVEITDTLPAGLTLLEVAHQWNPVAVTAGLPGDISVLTPAQYSIDANQITVNVSQELRQGDLLSQEGGQIRLKVKVNNGLNSGYQFINLVEGYFSSAITNVFRIEDQHLLTIDNPDLWLRKSVSNTNPVVGEKLVYSLTATNKGRHAAPDVVLVDHLPAGLCFDSMMGNLPSNWLAPNPVITGGNCLTQPTTLTWSLATNNPISDGVTPAVIPGNSPDIIIRYKVEVKNAVAGQVLTNNANITTSIPEDSNYLNGDTRTVTIPLADPYVYKQVSANSVVSGEVFDYEISYGNYSPQQATGAYLIDTLPPAKVIGVDAPNGETVYYYDQNHAPALSTLGITASYNFLANSNFKTSPLSFNVGEFPTHIIILPSGTLAGESGPFYVNLTMQALDPANNSHLVSNTVLENKVSIASAEADSDLTNNNAQAQTYLPNINLKVTKNVMEEGVAPGELARFFIKVENNGQVPACGVWVDDILGAGLQTLSSTFSLLELKNQANQNVFAIDGVGQPITTPVVIDYDSGLGRWYFGSRVANEYKNVCLPVGSSQIWSVFATAQADLIDGYEIINTARVGQDSGDTEDLITDNISTASALIRRADVAINKVGRNCGTDVTCVQNLSNLEVNPDEYIEYTLDYGNIGANPALNTVITDSFDIGVERDLCFVTGSLTGVPSGATVEYSLDAGQNWDYMPTGAIDCAVTDWRIHLASALQPTVGLDQQLKFKAHINPDANQLFIPNWASIKTNTPQTNYDNDHTSHIMTVPQTDLKLEKKAKVSAFNLSQMTEDTSIDYVLSLKNLGPQTAQKPWVVDHVPAELLLENQVVTVISSPSGTVYNFDCQLNQDVDQLLCRSDRDFAYLEEIDLHLVAKFKDYTALENDQEITNLACAKTITSDLNINNNCSSTPIKVGDFANVLITKSSFNQAHIGEPMQYVLRFNNVGNLDAHDWVITDTYDENLEDISYYYATEDNSPGMPNDISCVHDDVVRTITCRSASNQAFPAGGYGKVLVDAKVKDDPQLAIDNVLIKNQACITTSTSQTTTLDDCQNADKNVTPNTGSGIYGKVFYAANYHNDYVNNIGGLQAAHIYLSGLAADQSRIYGPLPTSSNFSQIMPILKEFLINKGAIDPSLTFEQIAQLPSYKGVQSYITTGTGEFSFTDLEPGTYKLYQKSPNGYAIISSTEGTIETRMAPFAFLSSSDGSDFGSNPREIVLGPNQDSVNNNYLDGLAHARGTIWYDQNRNGVIDANEPFAPGITVEAYQDGNLIGEISVDSNGQYDFTGLAVIGSTNTYSNYELKLKSGAVPNGYEITFGANGYQRTFNSGYLESFDNNFGLALRNNNTPTPQPSSTPSTNSSASNAPAQPPGCAKPAPGSAPTIERFKVLSDSQVMIYFKEGNAPFDRFIVSYGTSEDNFSYGVEINQADARSIQINDLDPKMKYYFKVMAANECAPGPWSNVVSTSVKPLLKTGQNIWWLAHAKN